MKFLFALVGTLVIVLCYSAIVVWLAAMKHHVEPLLCCSP
jgi:hypothetical protein